MWQVVIVFFTSSVKFLFAPGAAIFLFGFDFWQTILITSGGGAFGVCFFYYLSEKIIEFSLARKRKAILAGKSKKKRIFTRVNKTIVRIKHTMGIIGIAYLTLPFISIPLCAIIAAKFFRHKANTIVFLLTSVGVWSFLLTFLYWIGNEKVRPYFL